MPTAKYVPYQKLTSPPFAPPVGGYHGATSIYPFARRVNPIAMPHALNSGGGRPSAFRRWRRSNRPTAIRKLKMLDG